MSFNEKLSTGFNEIKHLLDFGPIARRRENRAKYQIEETGILSHVLPGHRYLDIGCGKGDIGGLIKSSKPEAEILGIDLNDRPTKRIRKVLGQTFSKADAIQLPFHEGTFHGILLFFVMHHMIKKDQIALLAEAKRVTKNQGSIFIAEDIVPLDDSNQLKKTLTADQRFNPDFFLNKPHNFRGKNEWRNVFEQAGFKSLQSTDYQAGEVKHTFFVLKNN